MADKSEGGAHGPGETERKETLYRIAAQAAVVFLLGEQISKPVDAVCKRVIASVSQSQNLFAGQGILVGSRAQDLHVGAEPSSDYDFLAPIQYNTNTIPKSCQNCKLDTPKHSLPLGDGLKPRVWAKLCGTKVIVDIKETKNKQQPLLWENNLCPDRVMTEFRECVRKALAEDPYGTKREQQGDRDTSTSQPERRKPVHGIRNVGLKKIKTKCPAVQISAEVNGQPVSIDLVPTIRTKVDVSMDWLKPDLSWLSDWWNWEPGTERRELTWNIEEIYKTGPNLVAQGSYWRLSFSLVETQFLRDIDADGGHRWLALHLLKKINMEKWRPRYGKVLTSYHLKTVLFWASYLNPETKHWDTLLEALGALLKVLEFCLEKKRLPSYFLHSVNLFDWRRLEEENSLKNLVLEALRLEVRLMRCSPQRYLRLSYNLAKPQGPGPFIQQARELDEFRREHREDLEKFKNGEIPDYSKSGEGDEPGEEITFQLLLAFD